MRARSKAVQLGTKPRHFGSRSALYLGLLVSFSVGCLNRELQPLDPCVVSGVRKDRIFTVEKVDLLFVVDNSDSMSQEQESLKAQFPRMIEVLTSGDADGDGTAEFPGVTSLRVGVVSTDMGDDNMSLAPTCNDPEGDGDDGLLLSSGNGNEGCMAQYPLFLEYDPDTDTPAAFAGDFACMAGLGTGGCGYEQQLEAGLKALTPADSPIEFRFGSLTSTGHGSTDNCSTSFNPSCFAREDSLLAIIIVSDEEDCSTPESELFADNSTIYNAPVNLRCFRFDDVLHPTQRYVDGLLALRGSPDLLVFGAIVGVPPDLVEEPNNINYDGILADDRMQNVPTTEMVGGQTIDVLTPSCNVGGVGKAYPPRRMVTVARDLEAAGANAIVQSICQSDFTGALDAIIDKIAEVLRGTCLPRPLNPDATGQVNCSVVEILPVGGEFDSCEDLVPFGREGTPVRVEEGRQVCRVNQVVPDRTNSPPTLPAGALGWYYDDFSPDIADRCGEDTNQRLSFTEGAEPQTGSEIRLECLQAVLGAGAREHAEPGSPCGGADEGDTFCGRNDAVIPGMICDELTNTCQIACESNADCGGALVCDVDRNQQMTPTGEPLRRICVNPTCSS